MEQTKETKATLDVIIEALIAISVVSKGFHYPINSNHEAVFSNLGLELKVTGLKRKADDTLVMKERLVLNIINYMKEANADFLNSSFWKKNQYILMMFYLYDYALEIHDYLFLELFLHEFSLKDLQIIKNDWQIIHNKLLACEAHNI